MRDKNNFSDTALRHQQAISGCYQPRFAVHNNRNRCYIKTQPKNADKAVD